MLVAELADDEARRLVAGIAQVRKVCLVPLLDAPMDGSLHVLEVNTPGQTESLLLLAEPVGPPTEQGFPLRLHPYGSPPPADVDPASQNRAVAAVRATKTRPASLSPRHTRDLLGDAPAGPAPDVEQLVGRDLAAGKLIVEELIGIGGMGAVYRARHKQLNKLVAVKVLHEQYRSDLSFCARFHAEALAVSQLDHPNVVRILDYGQEPDGLLYIAMDFLQGIELHDVLERERRLQLPRIVDIGMQVCAGLGHAHSRGMVHRDVKPSNIVLVQAENDEGRIVEVAKVCDFGIAAQAGARDLVGTPQYMSPEQCEGVEVDARSDVYSLGVILFELATGRLPFSHDNPLKLIDMQLNDPPPAPSSFVQIDRRLEALILKALAKDPAKRPQSMRELRSDLRELLRPSLELHAVGTGRSGRSSGESPVPPPGSIKQTAESFTNPHHLAMQLKKEPVSALREKIANPDIFAREARLVAGAMRVMLQMGELASLGQVLAIFRKVAADPNAGQSAEIAASLVRAMQDPQTLAPVAEKALADHDEAAPKLLAGLGLGAAHALYNARVRMQPTPPVRGRFVAAMRAIGPAGWPLVWAALQRNAPGDMRPHEPRLAEDLLRAAVAPPDDAAGSVVASYLRWGEVPVRRAAITPLVAVWGERSRPLLLAVLLKDPDEGVRVAALRGLRDLRAIDEHVVKKIESLLFEGGTTLSNAVSDTLKTAIAEALAEASADARPLAARVLSRVLSPKGGVFGMGKRGPAMPSPVLLAMARAYVAVSGEDARDLIEEVARTVEDPLRTQLVGLVGTRRGS